MFPNQRYFFSGFSCPKTNFSSLEFLKTATPTPPGGVREEVPLLPRSQVRDNWEPEEEGPGAKFQEFMEAQGWGVVWCVCLFEFGAVSWEMLEVFF